MVQKDSLGLYATTRRFYDNMFNYCGKEINITRFPLGTEVDLKLKEQFMSTFPKEINGNAWHEQWFVPGSFRKQDNGVTSV